MKRQHNDEGLLSCNKRKKENDQELTNIFPKDFCFGVLEFLESRFVLSVARLISVNWWQASMWLDYSLEFENVNESEEDGKELLEWIFECEILREKLISFKFTRNCLGEGIGIFKELKDSMTSPLLPKLTSLDLSGSIVDGDKLIDVFSIIDDKLMCNLTDLKLGFTGIQPKVIQAISNNNHLRKKLKSLSLQCSTNPLDGCLENMESLTSLNIEHCVIDETKLESLLNSQYIKNLSSLFITDVCEIKIDKLLAKSPHITNMTQLSCYNCSISGKHFDLPKFSNLKLLDLSGNLRKLDMLSHLSFLEYLKLSDCSLTDDQTEVFCKSRFTNTLISLDISYNSKITDKSLELITSTFTKLESLLLYGIHRITLESTKHITSRLKNLTELEMEGEEQSMSYQYFNNPTISKLKSLKLFSHEMGDEGLSTLIKSPFLSNLEVLWLGKASISNTSVILFASKECQMKKLRELDLRNNEKLDLYEDVGKEWLQDKHECKDREDEEEEDDTSLMSVIRENIPTLQKITNSLF